MITVPTPTASAALFDDSEASSEFVFALSEFKAEESVLLEFVSEVSALFEFVSFKSVLLEVVSELLVLLELVSVVLVSDKVGFDDVFGSPETL